MDYAKLIEKSPALGNQAWITNVISSLNVFTQ
jgi:hypothetical protein